MYIAFEIQNSEAKISPPLVKVTNIDKLKAELENIPPLVEYSSPLDVENNATIITNWLEKCVKASTMEVH